MQNAVEARVVGQMRLGRCQTFPATASTYDNFNCVQLAFRFNPATRRTQLLPAPVHRDSYSPVRVQREARASPGEFMAAVGVRRNDEHDAMGEFTTDLLARGVERAVHARGISAARLGHSIALTTIIYSDQAVPRRQGRAQNTEMHPFRAHTPQVWKPCPGPRMG